MLSNVSSIESGSHNIKPYLQGAALNGIDVLTHKIERLLHIDALEVVVEKAEPQVIVLGPYGSFGNSISAAFIVYIFICHYGSMVEGNLTALSISVGEFRLLNNVCHSFFAESLHKGADQVNVGMLSEIASFSASPDRSL